MEKVTGALFFPFTAQITLRFQIIIGNMLPHRTAIGKTNMASHTSGHKKMQDYRRRLRAAGLRPVQIWVPDTRSEHFVKEARRQSILVSRHKSEQETLDLIETIADVAPDQ